MNRKTDRQKTGGNILKALIMAFSTYSRIPMPNVEFSEKNQRASLCFFPLIGIVIGLCQWLLMHFFSFLPVILPHTDLTFPLIRSGFMCALPVLVTGGIHMDGFLDTVDAKSSFKSRQERLKILKDPHTGAFAVIYSSLYFIISTLLYLNMTEASVLLLPMIYGMERALSALSLLIFRKAREDGMAASFAGSAGGYVKWVLLAEAVLLAVLMVAYRPLAGIFCVLTAAACFVYYRVSSYKWLGGVTGDLAGHFLQLCEICMLFMAVLFGM